LYEDGTSEILPVISENGYISSYGIHVIKKLEVEVIDKEVHKYWLKNIRVDE
jgi:hypothetical protein